MDAILSIAEVCRFTGLNRTTVWRKTRAGAFPLPIELTDRKIGWPESEIKAWRENRPRRSYRARSETAPEAA